MLSSIKGKNILTLLLVLLVVFLTIKKIQPLNIQLDQEKSNEYSTSTLTRSTLSIEKETERVKQEGYTAIEGLNTWNSSESLNALIGACVGAEGYCKKTFFFYNGEYIGTDTSDPSSQISFVWRDDNTIALNYVLYRKDDAMCCPTAGATTVRFKWDGSKLMALDPIPSSGDVDNSRR